MPRNGKNDQQGTGSGKGSGKGGGKDKGSGGDQRDSKIGIPTGKLNKLKKANAKHLNKRKIKSNDPNDPSSSQNNPPRPRALHAARYVPVEVGRLTGRLIIGEAGQEIAAPNGDKRMVVIASTLSASIADRVRRHMESMEQECKRRQTRTLMNLELMLDLESDDESEDDGNEDQDDARAMFMATTAEFYESSVRKATAAIVDDLRTLDPDQLAENALIGIRGSQGAALEKVLRKFHQKARFWLREASYVRGENEASDNEYLARMHTAPQMPVPRRRSSAGDKGKKVPKGPKIDPNVEDYKAPAPRNQNNNDTVTTVNQLNNDPSAKDADKEERPQHQIGGLPRMGTIRVARGTTNSVPADPRTWNKDHVKIFKHGLRTAMNDLDDLAAGNWVLFANAGRRDVPDAALALKGSIIDAALTASDLYALRREGQFRVAGTRRYWTGASAKDVWQDMTEALDLSKFSYEVQVSNFNGVNAAIDNAWDELQAKRKEEKEEEDLKKARALAQDAELKSGSILKLGPLPIFTDCKSTNDLYRRLKGNPGTAQRLGVTAVSGPAPLIVTDSSDRHMELWLEASRSKGHEAYMEGEEDMSAIEQIVYGRLGAGTSHGFVVEFQKLSKITRFAPKPRVAKPIPVPPFEKWTEKWWDSIDPPDLMEGTGLREALRLFPVSYLEPNPTGLSTNNIDTWLLRYLERLEAAIITCRNLLRVLPTNDEAKPFQLVLEGMETEYNNRIIKARDRTIHDLVMQHAYSVFYEGKESLEMIEAVHKKMLEKEKVYNEKLENYKKVKAGQPELAVTALKWLEDAMEEWNDAVEVFICEVRDQTAIINRPRIMISSWEKRGINFTLFSEVNVQGDKDTVKSSNLYHYFMHEAEYQDKNAEAKRMDVKGMNRLVKKLRTDLARFPQVANEVKKVSQMAVMDVVTYPPFVSYARDEKSVENCFFLTTLGLPSVSNLEIYEKFVSYATRLTAININSNERGRLVKLFEDQKKKAAEEQDSPQRQRARQMLASTNREVFTAAREEITILIGHVKGRFVTNRLQEAALGNMVNRRR